MTRRRHVAIVRAASRAQSRAVGGSDLLRSVPEGANGGYPFGGKNAC